MPPGPRTSSAPSRCRPTVAGSASSRHRARFPGAAALVNLVENHGRAVFPAGAPPWYPNFSNAVYTNLHSAAAGQESVASAISAIASEVNSLNS